MKERPILFSAPMVRSILAGSKTQTRRIIKRPLQHPGWTEYVYFGPSKNDPNCKSKAIECGPDYPDDKDDQVPCPYGAVGDRLWVRETFRLPSPRWDGPNLFPFPSDISRRYEADGVEDGVIYRGEWGKGRPSIHLPRSLSRITLEITGIRVEQLSNISEADAVAEGIGGGFGNYTSYREDTQSFAYAKGSYHSLWESINGPGSWAANPWVWVIEFRRAA